ncbi:MAG TPA: hypothetical protein VFU22_22640, partial [Roseiflexaceae bacterium]|nr:hypothetical protein [Roseiflexaceae bacterium]
MNQPVQISNGWIAAGIAAIVFDILYPLALGLYVRTRLGVSWRYFGYGALIFVLFQLISRVLQRGAYGARESLTARVSWRNHGLLYHKLCRKQPCYLDTAERVRVEPQKTASTEEFYFSVLAVFCGSVVLNGVMQYANY